MSVHHVVDILGQVLTGELSYEDITELIELLAMGIDISAIMV